MGLETKLVQKLSQSLLMTPQLQQAIKLLQLGRLEYKEAIEKELLENPVLEEIKEGTEEGTEQKGPTVADSGEQGDAAPPSSEPPSESEVPEATAKEPKVDWEDYLENFIDSRGSATPKGSIDYDDKPSLEATLTKAETLQEHLISQVRSNGLSELQTRISFHIIGNLNRDGYLCVTHDEIAQECQCDTAAVMEVIEIFKSFDPPGVAARDLRECLLFQLEDLGLTDSLEAKIVSQHLEKIEKRKFEQIAKETSCNVEAVYKAIASIRRLEPRPGRPFADDTTRYVLPDIYVYKVGSEYVISLNEDGLPKLRVSPYYLELLRKGEEDNSVNRTYLNERLKAASWLIKSIHQRQQTIYRVTESIVKFQKEFLDHGIEKLKPLVLKDVADDIGMHESTVSRVTTNKYVHTPQGIFELKFFFTTGIKTAEGDVSSSSIKEKIKNLIGAETPEDPISDQKIVEILKAQNIDIARRTVAKYREALGILSSAKRKKLF
ncbi:MAG: RNA polymerase factor sigma-54 [Oligoflexia bacterium]|nr:RNA polymerase factor sigma-54 [Oligoflexia bacterium]